MPIMASQIMGVSELNNLNNLLISIRLKRELYVIRFFVVGF